MGANPYQEALKASCPDEWRIVPLRDVAFYQEGPGILAKDFRESGVPLIRLRGVEGDYVTTDGCNFLDPEMVEARWSHFRLERGDLLISTSASFGHVSVVTDRAAGAIPYTGLIRFRSNSDQLDHGYLRAFLGSQAFLQQVEAMASGSVIRHFGPMHLRQMAIPVPSMDEQRFIGDLASLFAERLALVRQQDAMLEAIAQSLFRSWFVDFDPVGAKMEGRVPVGMDADTAALFPSEFESSPIGMMPKGWQVGTFGALAKLSKSAITPGRTPDEEFEHYSLPAFDTGQMPDRVLGTSIRSNKTRVPSGAVLISKLNPHIPRIWYVGPVGERAVCSTEFLPWTPAEGVSAEYIYLLARSSGFTTALGQLVTGTSSSHQRVNAEHLSGMRVVVPPREAILALTSVVAPMMEQVLVNRERSTILARLRDTLLPRLISGKLCVPDAEQAIEKAFV